MVSTDGATPLFNSCSSGSAACVRLILQHGTNIHTPYQLVSPVHEAAKKGVCVCVHLDPPERRFSYCFVSPSGHRECLELLLSYGVHINMELPGLGTPLYSACMAQAAACVMLLLHSGNVNTVTHRLIPPRQENLGTCKSNFHSSCTTS